MAPIRAPTTITETRHYTQNRHSLCRYYIALTKILEFVDMLSFGHLSRCYGECTQVQCNALHCTALHRAWGSQAHCQAQARVQRRGRHSHTYTRKKAVRMQCWGFSAGAWTGEASGAVAMASVADDILFNSNDETAGMLVKRLFLEFLNE